MAAPPDIEAEEPLGVFYATEDYAGILRRLLIMLVDGIVLVLLAVVAIVLAAALTQRIPGWEVKAFYVVFLVWYVYMAILKITPLGTLGYRLAGVRLVTIYGRTPSIWRSSLRFAFLLIGPLNPVLDIIWLGGEVDRQSLRDKFVATYVVRRDATPMGHGPVRLRRMFLLGWTLLAREVEREASMHQT